MNSCTTGVTFSASLAIEDNHMVRTLLVRGMLTGLLAGLLAFGFLKIYGEPHVDRAIAFEAQMDEARHAAEHAKGAAGHAHGMAAEAEPELVSRKVQAGIGLFTAVVVYSTAFGGLFALVFAFACGRMPGALTPRGIALLLAAIGFVAVYAVPSLKYPANPPSVGNPDTIGMRTALYFGMILISIAAMTCSIFLKRLLLPRFGAWNANFAVAGFYIVLVAVAGFVLPAINEIPAGFPADLLWDFRMASLGAQAILWATLAFVFGAAAQRVIVKRAAA
jgi:hypothetical protein